MFFPRLRAHDFLQEGHRLESNGSGGLMLKGVVFNEMKGAMQDSSSVFHRALYSSLFHHSTHHHNRCVPPPLTYTLLSCSCRARPHRHSQHRTLPSRRIMSC